MLDPAVHPRARALRRAPHHDPAGALADMRRRATRSRMFRNRLRRLIPGMVVTSAALAGTGGLATWVASQPGVAASPVRVQATYPPATDHSRAMAALQSELKADASQIDVLNRRLAALAAKRAAEEKAASEGLGAPGPTGGPGGAGSGGSSFSTLPPIAPLQPLSIAVPSPAPAVNATTGASHAIP